MSRATEIRQAQEQLESGWTAEQDARENRPPKDMHHDDPDYCAVNRIHRFSMKGNDGIFRCWYCCKRREA